MAKMSKYQEVINRVYNILVPKKKYGCKKMLYILHFLLQLAILFTYIHAHKKI